MVHKKIRIPKDIAFEVMDELGKMEDAEEFIYLNKDDLADPEPSTSNDLIFSI